MWSVLIMDLEQVLVTPGPCTYRAHIGPYFGLFRHMKMHTTNTATPLLQRNAPLSLRDHSVERHRALITDVLAKLTTGALSWLNSILDRCAIIRKFKHPMGADSHTCITAVTFGAINFGNRGVDPRRRGPHF